MYGGAILLIIPFQVVVIHQFAIGSIVPDSILLTICLVGLWRGKLEAVVLGIGLGFLQDLLSGSMLWVNLITKPLIGLAAGVWGRTVLSLTSWIIPIFVMGISFISNLLVLVFFKIHSPEMDIIRAFFGTFLPQVLYDGVFGAIVLLAVFLLFPTLYRNVRNL